MRPQIDSSGQRYVEVPSLKGEFIRATLVTDAQWASPYDCVRIQVKQADGKLRQGPELPEPVIFALFEAMRQLLASERVDS